MAQELGLLWVMDEPGGDLPYVIQPDAKLSGRWSSCRHPAGSTTTPFLSIKSRRLSRL